MRLQIITTCFFILSFCITSAEATLSDTVATIYVEDNNGKRIATGSGGVIASDGLIVTDIHLVRLWLETIGYSIFVRTVKGYYPLKSLVSLDRDNDLAVFSINAKGLNTVPPASDYIPSRGENVYFINNQDGYLPQKLENAIKNTRQDGSFLLSTPLDENLRGAAVFNSSGKAIGIATVHEGVDMVIPIANVLRLVGRSPEKIIGTNSSDEATLKKAKSAIESNRASADDYLRLGAAYMKTGMPENAIEAFHKAVERDSDSAEAYHGLGIAYAEKEMYVEAVESLEKAVTLDPSYAKAFGNLGFLYDHLGRHSNAVDAFKRAITLRPEYAEAYNGLGVSYARGRNYEEAIQAFRKALNLRPQFKKARFNLGLSYLSLGNEESALREEALLRKLDPDMADKLLELIEIEDIEAGDEDNGDNSEADET